MEENHLPAQMWVQLLIRLKNARQWLVTDIEKMRPYLSGFNLYMLQGATESYEEIRFQPLQFLYKHRYEVVALYDAFIAWSEAQLDIYGLSGELGNLFNIEGP